MKRLFYLLGIGLLMLRIPGNAQTIEISRSVIGSSGGYYSGANLCMGWTIGEVMVETISSTNLILTQGFQQPDSGDCIVNNLLSESGTLSVKVFPNPFSDEVNIKLQKSFPAETQIEVIDLKGQVLLSKTSSEQNENLSLDLSSLAQGRYYLHFKSESGQTLQSVAVQKIH